MAASVLGKSVVRFALLACLAPLGCSAPDPGGPGAIREHAPQGGSTGTTGAQPAPPPPATTTATPPPPQPPDDGDAGLPPPPQDAAPPAIDAGTATPGTCANPACASGGGQCGCKARGANGLVLLGCASGGQCVCIANAQAEATFDENGACADPAALEQAFLTNCTCH